ncbi:MAG: iron ABC transporter permease [Thermomicrobiales bacterium]|nr:iron ABC transporter permease [Thermomicrobiales bacterium]MCO5228102.1 iron ABC transporter permease [Thermomicrobiales bacterium]
MASAVAAQSEQTPAPVRRAPKSRTALMFIGLLVLAGLAALLSLFSLRFGSLPVTTREAWDAVFRYNVDSYEQTIVREMRVPRTIIAFFIGGGLAVAGTVMQGVTRNPLGDPSILGVSAGASFGVTTAIFLFGISTPAQFVWFAFPGAAVASIVVYSIASVGRGGPTPVRLALAGVVMSSLLGAWTSALLLMSEQTLDLVRFWSVGSVAGRNLSVLWTMMPFILPATLACLLMGHQLNVLSMGEESARALGMNTQRVRMISSGLVVILTGASVAVAGPIGFVGLATPHIVRSIVGADYRWILPYSFFTGAALLTTADTVGRVIARPSEIQVGVVMAFVGAPFLIALARRRTVAS